MAGTKCKTEVIEQKAAELGLPIMEISLTQDEANMAVMNYVTDKFLQILAEDKGDKNGS